MPSQKYFIYLAYKGTNYQGWQRQANGLGVQEIVEDQLSQMFKQKILLHACGRTDAGVHASQFFCHTIIEKSWDFDAVFRLNKMLPNDIRVYEFIPVQKGANAQLDAISRTYDYYFHLIDHPFLADLSTFYLMENPAIEAMETATALIKNYRDFHSFCKQPAIHNSTFCNVTSTALSFDAKKEHFRFRITANRFLKSMVRMLVGNIIRIGQRKLSLSEFEHYLKQPQLTPNPVFAYPQGLYLSQVVYPDLQRDVKSPFLF